MCYHSMASRYTQERRVTSKRNKWQQKAPRSLPSSQFSGVLPLTLVSWQPIFFPEKRLFFPIAPPCPLPPPGEAEVPEGQREGQRSPPAWPGATRATSCQEPSASCCPPQGHPNKVTFPPESILPFKERLCLEPRTDLRFGEDFIQPFTDTVSIKGAHPGPSATALVGRPGLDPEWITEVLNFACNDPFLCSFSFSSTSVSHPLLSAWPSRFTI